MSKSNRLLLLALVALAAGSTLGSACSAAPPPPKKKNVILITLDTTRADYLSCYGYAQPTTPNLDALAASGTRFDYAISTASVTPVSHASILTGLNNNEHRLRVLYADGGYRLPKDVPTLANVLHDEGYRTVAVHSAFPVSRFFGFERGFDVFDDLNTQITAGNANNTKGWKVAEFQRRSDETTDLVEAQLGEQQPFFLWVHYWDPHDWSKKPPPDQMPAEDELVDPATGQPLRPGTALYAAEVKYMDSQLGRLFDSLKERKLFDDALVVVVADHGQGLFDHDWAAHRLLYQEQIRVPLIVRVPGAQQQPVVADLVRSIDIFPTVLDYLGLQPPKPVSGRSLRALIEGGADAPRIAFADQINGYDENAGMIEKRPLDDFVYCVIDGKSKLLYRPGHPDASELFDLASDPKEALSLYASQPAEALRLRKLLAEHHPWVVGKFEKLDDAGQGASAQEALQGLGYTAGQTIDPTWSWTCPEHMDEPLTGPSSRCPKCGSPPLIIKR